MMYLAPEHFAASMGIGVRAAQIAFQKVAEGKPRKGIDLPVIALPGNRGGAGGKVWALAVGRCPDEWKAKFGQLKAPSNPSFNGR